MVSSSSTGVTPCDQACGLPLQQLRPQQCLSIIACERTLDLQLLDLEMDLGVEVGDHHSVEWFIDMLALLSIKAIHSSSPPGGGYAGRETVLRLRHWRRVKTNSSYQLKSSRDNSRCHSRSTSNSNIPGMLENNSGEVTLAAIGGTAASLCQNQFPPQCMSLSVRRLSEAQLFMEILSESIEIEEERYGSGSGSDSSSAGSSQFLSLSHQSGPIECSTLWLDPGIMRIYVTPAINQDASGGDTSGHTTKQSEIRVSLVESWLLFCHHVCMSVVCLSVCLSLSLLVLYCNVTHISHRRVSMWTTYPKCDQERSPLLAMALLSALACV
jgi:hypothetical protein